MPRKTLPIFACAISQGLSMAATLRRISDTANMPIMIGISVRPPASSALPKVKRGKPAGLSRPTDGDQQAEQQRHDALQRVADARGTPRW